MPAGCGLVVMESLGMLLAVAAVYLSLMGGGQPADSPGIDEPGAVQQILREEMQKVHASEGSKCRRIESRETAFPAGSAADWQKQHTQPVDPVTGWELFVSSDRLCAGGLRSADNSTCCPKSCVACGGMDDASNRGCSQRSGGAVNCCGRRIFRSLRRCFVPHHVACRILEDLTERVPWHFPWAPPAEPLPAAAAAVPIALGLYAPTCQSVAAFTRACIGCSVSAHLRITAVIDEVSVCCEAADLTASASALLSASTLAMHRSGKRINFFKTRALFVLMVRSNPDARWFVKVDTDAMVR